MAQDLLAQSLRAFAEMPGEGRPERFRGPPGPLERLRGAAKARDATDGRGLRRTGVIPIAVGGRIEGEEVELEKAVHAGEFPIARVASRKTLAGAAASAA